MKKPLMFPALLLTCSLIVPGSNTYAVSQKSTVSPEKDITMMALQEASSLSGKVVETMNSGGYSYVNIEKNGKKIWVAVTQIKVEVGQNISFKPGMTMKNFKSKTLNRTFETIVFSSGVIEQQGRESVKKSSGQKQSKGSSNIPINVKKATGPGAYTVAELYEKSIELDRKYVIVKGQVVKFSADIMGKNWIHIQDGSGNPSKGTNDILVTSQDVLSVGDIVTLKGTLSKDKDFGEGYKYAVIVEDARIKK
ncbi:DNA-binding protein [bacterium]|nr:MAG: DNA-binding protein [bacterium]